MITNKDWDFIAKINDTDLYGLLNIMLEEIGEEEDVIDTLDNIKSAFNECFQEENDDAYTRLTLMNGNGDMLELEGTEKHFADFEAERKERNDALFPSCMSLAATISLALEHGLSVKKLKLNNKQGE